MQYVWLYNFPQDLIYLHIAYKHPTKQQLSGHQPLITKTIQVRRIRYAGHCWRSRDEVMYFYRPLHTDEQRQDDQLEPTYSGCVPIRDIVMKTCRQRWTIGSGDERGSGISVQMMMMIFGSKEAPLLQKTGVPFFCVTRMDIDNLYDF